MYRPGRLAKTRSFETRELMKLLRHLVWLAAWLPVAAQAAEPLAPSNVCARAVAALALPWFAYSNTGQPMEEGKGPDGLPDGFSISLSRRQIKLGSRLTPTLGPKEVELWYGRLGPDTRKQISDNLVKGYESHGPTQSYAAARMWGAWVAGEVGIGQAVPYLKNVIAADYSPEARASALIALGRLEGDLAFPTLKHYFERGTTAASKWTRALFFEMGDGVLLKFQPRLSEVSAAAVGLGYLPTTGTIAASVDALLLGRLESLLDHSPAAGLARVRRWGGAGAWDEAVLHALIFSLGKRQTATALLPLQGYFRSLGLYTVERPHEMPIALVLAAMYRIDRTAAVQVVREKLGQIALIHEHPEVVSPELAESFIEAESELRAAAQLIFSELDWQELMRDFRSG